MNLSNELKKYKGYNTARRFFVILTILLVLLPAFFAALVIFPEHNAEGATALGGGTALLIGAIFLILRPIIRSGKSGLPYTLTLFASVVLAFLTVLSAKNILDRAVGASVWYDGGRAADFVFAVKGIVEDAFSYLIIQSVGTAFGLIFELAAKYCASRLEEIKLFLGKGEKDVAASGG